MKFGICSEIFKDWNDIERTVAYVKETGYDGLEVAPFTLSQYVYNISASDRKKIVQAADNNELEILGIHWVFVGPDNVYLTHPDPEIRAATQKYLEHLVDFCADIGGKVIIFGSPKQRSLLEGVSYSQAFEFARSIFEKTMARCESHDVTICMEPLTHLETDFCHTTAQAVDLIKAVDHPNFQLILDTKAMAFESEDRAALIKKYAQYLKHYHANDENLNGPGFGEIDFAPIFDALKSIDFNDYVSVEVFNFDPGPECIAQKSLEYMKQFV